MWGKISQYHQDIEKWDLSPCVPRAGADCIPNTHHCSAGRHWWQFQKIQTIDTIFYHSPLLDTLWWMYLQFLIYHQYSSFQKNKICRKFCLHLLEKHKPKKKKICKEKIVFFLLFSIDTFCQGRKGGEWLCLYEIIISPVSSLQWPGPAEPAQLLLSMLLRQK